MSHLPSSYFIFIVLVPVWVFFLLLRFKGQDQTSLDGYSTFEIGRVSSFIDLILTKRDRMAAEPALSFVPEALAPPNGC